jgi:hypothetical protein
MKLPAFQFYPGDWRKDPGVQSLDYQCRGVWFEILCLMHESTPRGLLMLAGKPMSDEALARLLGLDLVLVKQILTTLDNHGVSSRDPATGALMSRRMVRDDDLRKLRKLAGEKGGNPVLLNQKSTTQLKQKSTPSSSSSSSNNTPQQAAEKKKVQREPLIDALATIGGGRLEEVTNWKTAAYARSQIVAVTPELTVDEIKRRAANYRSHFEGAALTPTALAKHWALCATPKQSFADNGPRVTRVQL